MPTLRAIVWLLLAAATLLPAAGGLRAQMPSLASDHEIREVSLTASATPEWLALDFAFADLHRYVQEAIRPAAEIKWVNCFAKHRERLVFVDSAGFWWMLDPTAK